MIYTRQWCRIKSGVCNIRTTRPLCYIFFTTCEPGWYLCLLHTTRPLECEVAMEECGILSSFFIHTSCTLLFRSSSCPSRTTTSWHRLERSSSTFSYWAGIRSPPSPRIVHTHTGTFLIPTIIWEWVPSVYLPPFLYFLIIFVYYMHTQNPRPPLIIVLFQGSRGGIRTWSYS